MGCRGALASALGSLEIIAAILIAIRPLWPHISAAGSALAIVLFIGTLSFLFTTPVSFRYCPEIRVSFC